MLFIYALNQAIRRPTRGSHQSAHWVSPVFRPSVRHVPSMYSKSYNRRNLQTFWRYEPWWWIRV